MHPVEIPIEDLKEIDILGENPLYRFEEIINDDSKNDLDLVLRGYLQLDYDSNDIGDYEIKDDMVVLYIDDDQDSEPDGLERGRT